MELSKKLQELKPRVLVIGAGGIGCELLKTLVLSGFRDLEVVDLDTIDVSNLNRQFLFNKSHIGKSKAEVACEVVKGFVPDLKIKAHHANVKNPEFNIEFYRRFNLVINGLDNLGIMICLLISRRKKACE